jgi:response regulator of citrate/malate metabolism
MDKNILVVYNSISEAGRLVNMLNEQMPGFSFARKDKEHDVVQAIESRYYSLLIIDLDIRLKGDTGIELVKHIFDMNPFVKLICLSAGVTGKLAEDLMAVDQHRLVDIVQRRRLPVMVQELKLVVEHYYKKVSKTYPQINDSLLQYYEIVKHEMNPLKKGLFFESFIRTLLETCGYRKRRSRMKERFLKEIEMVMAQDIHDPFLAGFGKYILIDCKNDAGKALSRSEFLNFSERIKDRAVSSSLGILAAPAELPPNVREEAMSASSESGKIMFLSDQEILRLIAAGDKHEEFKMIIDEQLNGIL